MACVCGSVCIKNTVHVGSHVSLFYDLSLVQHTVAISSGRNDHIETHPELKAGFAHLTGCLLVATKECINYMNLNIPSSICRILNRGHITVMWCVTETRKRAIAFGRAPSANWVNFRFLCSASDTNTHHKHYQPISYHKWSRSSDEYVGSEVLMLEAWVWADKCLSLL